jgi:hypothetical protein
MKPDPGGIIQRFRQTSHRIMIGNCERAHSFGNRKIDKLYGGIYTVGSGGVGVQIDYYGVFHAKSLHEKTPFSISFFAGFR